MPSTDTKISEIFIPGPAGRLEAKYFKSKSKKKEIHFILGADNLLNFHKLGQLEKNTKNFQNRSF